MKKSHVIAAMVAFVVLVATGLASTQPRPIENKTGAANLEDIHFRYYEQIRPSLLGEDVRPVAAACDDTETVVVRTAGK